MGDIVFSCIRFGPTGDFSVTWVFEMQPTPKMEMKDRIKR